MALVTKMNTLATLMRPPQIQYTKWTRKFLEADRRNLITPNLSRVSRKLERFVSRIMYNLPVLIVSIIIGMNLNYAY